MAHVPVANLDQLRSSGPKGARLADSLTLHLQPHLPFILGMYNLYMTLVSMGYFTPKEISWPPQTDRFNAHDWLAYGLSTTVVDLLKVLPLVDFRKVTSDVFAILPDMAPHDYFAEATSTYVRDPRSLGDPAGFSPSGWLPLAYRLDDSSLACFYNVEDLDRYAQKLSDYGRRKTTLALDLAEAPVEWEPAQQAVNTWLTHLRELTWVPDRFSDQAAIIDLASIESLTPGARAAEVHPFHRQQTRRNASYARRRIYQDYGWPSAQYGREECQAALEQFNARLRLLEQKVKEALHPSMEPYMYYPEVQAGSAAEYIAFLEEAAGDDADRESA